MQKQTINNWQDLESFGIDPLTGEADAYMLRILCDVNTAGYLHLCRFFGVVALDLKDSWNAKMQQGSIMLPYAILEPLAIFLLFETGWQYVAVSKENGAIFGIDEEAYQRYKECDWLNIRRNPGYSRNVHQMSGRVE